MDDNFVTVEKAYLSDLIRAKGRMETILDCLLEVYIPKYERYDANEIANSYCKSRLGIKAPEPCCDVRPLKRKENKKNVSTHSN